VSCNGTKGVIPTAATTYTLTATGPGGTTSQMVTIDCHAVANPAPDAGAACPTGATLFCESVPIVATDSTQAQDACNVCNGPASCTLDAADVVSLGGASAWVPPAADRPAYYVFLSAAVPACTNPTPTAPAAGDISGSVCPAPRWAP
jgi:hypothetical protein